MALTVKMETDLTVSLDSEQKNILWEFTDQAINQIVRSDLIVHSAGVASIAAAGTMVLPMGDVVTGAILLVRANKQVALKLNGGTQEIIIKNNGSYKGMLVLHGSFTAVTAVNKDATAAAQVEYCFVGADS